MMKRWTEQLWELWGRTVFYWNTVWEGDLYDCCIALAVLAAMFGILIVVTLCFTSRWFARMIGQ